MAETREVTVRIGFGEHVRPESSYEYLTISVARDGSDSIHDLKAKIATAAGGAVTAEDLQLFFSGNEVTMGRQYQRDPSVNERELRLAQFNVLPWLERFPHWHLSASLLPATPPPPGEAVHRAAAVTEKKDPERYVKEAMAKGDIPKPADLPAPWGPKPYVAGPQDGFIPKYPEGFSPLVDINA